MGSGSEEATQNPELNIVHILSLDVKQGFDPFQV